MPHRRAFLKTLAGTALATAASTARVRGANDRVRIGVIGNGLIGRRHLLDFKAQPDCEIAGISEVSDERMDDGVATAGNNPPRHADFRRMLERQDIDAVVISTPDHWHALMTTMACAAGKDVYVEKPLTHVLREGEWMIDAARRHARVVQVGTQQRAGAHYQRARQLLQNGHIGDIRAARVSTARNILPGFSQPVGRPLTAAQWDLWLGPAPAVAYEPARGLYHFRWFWDYSGGQTTNLLSHEVDIVQWITGQVPRRVAAIAPQNFKAQELQGTALIQLKRPRDAFTPLQQAARIAPRQGIVRVHIGTAWLQLKDLQKAQNSFSRAVELEPRNATIHLQIGRAWQAAGQLEQAMSAYRRAISLEPTQAEAYIGVGDVFFEQGNYSSAVNLFRQAISYAPNDPDGHLKLGKAMKQLGRKQEAVSSLEMAKSLMQTQSVPSDLLIEVDTLLRELKQASG